LNQFYRIKLYLKFTFYHDILIMMFKCRFTLKIPFIINKNKFRHWI